ncbi:MAG: glutathione S-transferase family protein [Hyphomicrobiaceae bacterium]
MPPTITGFKTSPDGGQGMARDMPVRWALEETGRPYDVRLLTFEELKQPKHRALQPFGQIPTFEQDGLVLFESGAIVLHIALTHAGLLPDNPHGRARAISWMFAAASSVEPVIVEREMTEYTEIDKPWYEKRLPLLDERIRGRLAVLSKRLGDAPWLEGDFTAGDLMMVTVLRRLTGSDVLGMFPNLLAYVARGEARPAFKRAFAAQLAVFRAASGG